LAFSLIICVPNGHVNASAILLIFPCSFFAYNIMAPLLIGLRLWRMKKFVRQDSNVEPRKVRNQITSAFTMVGSVVALWIIAFAIVFPVQNFIVAEVISSLIIVIVVSPSDYRHMASS
jgi:hypothetical protein